MHSARIVGIDSGIGERLPTGGTVPGTEGLRRAHTGQECPSAAGKSHSPFDTVSRLQLEFKRMKATGSSREELIQILRDRHITPTRQRIEIAHALFSRCEHLSADRVFSIVNGRACETSKATVYNTLNLFVDRRLIREVIVDPNRVFYDPNTTPHHHFYNVDTGELTDIDEADVRIAGLPQLPSGMTVEGVDVIVRIRSH